jgi:preprotein translocase subunit SecY
MNSFIAKVKTVFTDEALRKRVFFMLAALALFRLLAALPIPLNTEIVLASRFAVTRSVFPSPSMSPTARD